jgi:voltage-gated potassium channel
MNYIIHLIQLLREREVHFTERNRLAHFQQAVRRLYIAMAVLVFAVLVGTLGYRMIEHVPWFDAYYMSLVTLSTVGFGEVIPLSFEGRLFTSFLIIFNIGFFAYAISTITSILTDADIHAFFQDFKMMERIKKLQGHTIVCGFGRHATEVCKELAKENLMFVVIESDEKMLDMLRSETSYLFLRGDATNDDVLLEAGIAKASSIVVTLPLDANNVFVVMSARQLNPAIKIISRLNYAFDEMKLRRAGANHVVMPERIGGFYMATLINKPDLVEFFNLISNMGTSRVVFEEIPVDQLKWEFQRRSILEGGLTEEAQLPIIALRHADGRYELNPGEHTVLLPDMHIVVLGDLEQIKRFKNSALETTDAL